MDDARKQQTAVALGQRFVQAPPPPCTSEDGLEAATPIDAFTDRTGAQWQVRASQAAGCDWTVVAMSRPLATGMLTFVRGAPSAYADAAVMQLKALTSIRHDADNGEIKDAVLAAAGPSDLAR
jgi:hypothetical protein